MREKQQYKTVAITYADDKPLEFIKTALKLSLCGIDAIYVFDESDVKSLIIGRTGMKDIKVNVNGGKYDND